MKKVLYIMLAACAALMVSCAKDNGNDIEDNSPETIDNNVTGPAFTGRTLTFSVEMDLPAATKAALDGLDIKWESGDSIGIATNNSATIVSYPVTDLDGTKGKITVNEVVGATDYYAIFRGSNATYKTGDFTGVTFNTETKTFSGLTVGNQQVSVGDFNSHLYISNGYPLTMAGKTTGLPQSGNLIMKPCLALFQLQLAVTDLPGTPRCFYKNIPYVSSKSINHNHYYSAIRGFNLYQKGGSTIYSSGDFSVAVAADGSLTTTPGASKTEKRELSQLDTLKANTKYLMCLIPGGSVTSFMINFLGYKSNGNESSDITWDAVYTMTKAGSFTVAPGDFYDLGTLNPIGRKKAQLEAADEVEDAAVPPIAINGTMSDWDPASNALLTSDNYASQTGNSHFKEMRVAYDEAYLYVYIKRDRLYTLWGSNQAYYYLFFDTDNNSANGTEKDGYKYDYGFFFYPFGGTKGDNEASAVPGWASSPASSSVADGFTSGGGISIEFAGAYDETIVELEFKISRSSLGIEKNDVINIAAYGNKSADSKPYTRIAGFEIKN